MLEKNIEKIIEGSSGFVKKAKRELSTPVTIARFGGGIADFIYGLTAAYNLPTFCRYFSDRYPSKVDNSHIESGDRGMGDGKEMLQSMPPLYSRSQVLLTLGCGISIGGTMVLVAGRTGDDMNGFREILVNCMPLMPLLTINAFSGIYELLR